MYDSMSSGGAEKTSGAYQQKLKSAWKDMTQKSVIEMVPKSVIEDWERCRSLNVDPLQKRVSNILTESKLQLLRKDNAMLLEVSRPQMENIFDLISSKGFIVALSNKEG